MNYYIITIVSISIISVLLYYFFNNVFSYFVSKKIMMLCATASIIISLLLPRVFINIAEIVSTFTNLLGLILIFSVIMAFMFESERKKKMTFGATPIPIQPNPTATNNNTPISPQSDTIYDLMDFALQEQQSLNYKTAIKTFYYALQLYSDSDEAPFIIIRLGNLLKELGRYSEAINLYTSARNYRTIKEDSLLEQEFIETIAYLRIINNLLLAQGLGSTPFQNIPIDIRTQIELDFKDWRK